MSKHFQDDTPAAEGKVESAEVFAETVIETAKDAMRSLSEHKRETCVHPYADVIVLAEDAFYDDPGIHWLTYCSACNTALVHENKLPSYAPDEAKEAARLCGVPVEPRRPVPPPRPGDPNKAGVLDAVLERLYAPWEIEQLVSLSPPDLER